MRAARGMSQRDLAEATGIPGIYLSNFETGTTLPTPDKEAQIKEALDWPEDFLAETAFGILELGTKPPSHENMCFTFQVPEDEGLAPDEG